MFKTYFSKIFSPPNRGILFDVFIFFLNFTLLHIVTKTFISFTKADEKDFWAHFNVTLFLTALVFLAPIGALLKRRWFWRRIEAQNKVDDIEDNAEIPIFGIKFCFVWMLILSLLAGVMWCSLILENYLSWTEMFLGVFFGAPAISLLNAWLISSYFKKPEGESRLKFLDTALSASLGDICIFLNIICFQIFWGLLNSEPWRASTGVFDIIESLIAFFLMVLLFYLPARSFYLIEDLKRPSVWLTILLANLPSFLFVAFGIKIF